MPKETRANTSTAPNSNEEQNDATTKPSAMERLQTLFPKTRLEAGKFFGKSQRQVNQFYDNLNSNDDVASALRDLEDEMQGEPAQADGKFTFLFDKQVVITPDNKVLLFRQQLAGRGPGKPFGAWFDDLDGNRYLLKFDEEKVCAQEATMTADFMPEKFRKNINVATLGYEKTRKGISYLTIQPAVHANMFEASSSLDDDGQIDIESERSSSPLSLRGSANSTTGSNSNASQSSTGSVGRFSERFSDISRSTSSWSSFELEHQNNITTSLSNAPIEQLTELAAIYFASTAMRNESVHTGQIMAAKDEDGNIIGHAGIDYGARNRYALARVEKDDVSPDKTSDLYMNTKFFHQKGNNYLTLVMQNKKLHYLNNQMWANANVEAIVNAEVYRFHAQVNQMPETEKERFLNYYLAEINEEADDKIVLPKGCRLEDKIAFVEAKIIGISAYHANQMKERAIASIPNLLTELKSAQKKPEQAALNDDEIRELNQTLVDNGFCPDITALNQALANHQMPTPPNPSSRSSTARILEQTSSTSSKSSQNPFAHVGAGIQGQGLAIGLRTSASKSPPSHNSSKKARASSDEAPPSPPPSPAGYRR